MLSNVLSVYVDCKDHIRDILSFKFFLGLYMLKYIIRQLLNSTNFNHIPMLLNREIRE